jgi:hypothetical protein
MMHVLSVALLGVILVLEFALIVETILADRMRKNEDWIGVQPTGQ